MYAPISMAMGIVAPTVKVPHGLWLSALTTTSASTAMRITMIEKTPTSAAKPPIGPISSFAICPSERALRRRLPHRMQKSCTAPPSTTPKRIHNVPGRKPNCAASVGPISGPGPAMAAKWWPNTTQRLVGTKSRPSLMRSAGVCRSGSSAKSLAARNAP